MSFQDFVLNRQQDHNNNTTKNPKSKGYNAWLAMSGRARQKAIVDNENEGEPARIVPKSQRGVRPRLETKCPVTSRTLLTTTMVDDNMSVQSLQSQKSCLTSRSHHEDDPKIPSVQRSSNSSQRQSIYSHLTKEIVNFQKMVAELETLTEVSGQSPESQWRTRILIRSAQDADRDIWKRLYEYESSHGENPTYSRAQMASRKLHRDFQRVHKQLKSIMVSYEKRQQVEIAFLTSARQQAQGEEKKEDFFDRVMREREQEVDHIQKSMQKVNEIYSDLAILVDGQQEKIDKIANDNEDSKARTKSGLEQIHQAAFGLCAPLNRSMNDWTTLDESKTNSSSNKTGSSSQSASASARLKRGELRVEEEFKWTMPFETIGDDMQAVREDVFRLIEDFSMDGDSSPMGSAMSCSSLNFGQFKPTRRDGGGVNTPSKQQAPRFHHQYIIDDNAIELPIQYRSSSMKHQRI